MKATECWKCGYLMDDSTCLTCITSEKKTPKPGDMSVCINCGAALVFGDDLRPRKPLGFEWNGIGKSGRRVLRKAQRFIRARGRIDTSESVTE